MPKGLSTILACLLFSILTTAVLAQPAKHAVWDRDAAWQAANSVDTTATRRSLVGLTLAGSALDVIALLEESAGRADWPLPAREKLIHDFTRELRALPAAAVPARVMDYLVSYEPRTLVAHEDNQAYQVPLFNIRGQAQGVSNAWRRGEATIEAQALLASNPRSLVDAWSLEAHPAARQGYLLSLEQASPEQLRGVSRSATRRIADSPDLTALAGQAALMSGDLGRLERVMSLGQGPALAGLMRDSTRRLAPADTLRLLRTTLNRGAPGNAALALAELGSVALQSADGAQLVFAQLEHPNLGSAAALVLARNGSPRTLEALQALAAQADKPLRAARARLALDLHANIQAQESGP